MSWPVRRYPFGGSPTHCGRLPGGTLNRASNLHGLSGNMRISCCCKSHGTKPTHLGFGKPILTLDSLAARPLGRAVSSAPYFSTLLLSPDPFGLRLGCALTTVVPVVSRSRDCDMRGATAHLLDRRSRRVSGWAKGDED